MVTMPASRKLARKSVSMLMELGLSKRDAARVVQLVCDEAASVIWRHQPDLDVTWLAEIHHEASQLAAQQGGAAAAVQTYSAAVSRWARDFDRGHTAERSSPKGDQLPRRASAEFWPDSWPSAGVVHRDDMPAYFDVPGHERPGQTGRETGA